ncbi:MAG: hypothetical protein JNK41_07880 [Saprospiraceae bacterium]|nr:hypothetical protein [Saprospiraceae bacterium]
MKIFFALILFTLFASCKSLHYTSDNLPEKQLIIGSEGGFTGFGSEYILCESGQVFKRSVASSKTEEIKISKKSKVKKLFKNAFEQPWINSEYQNPGNFSSFMIFKDKNIQHKFIWTQNDTLINPSVKRLVQEAKELLNQNADK